MKLNRTELKKILYEFNALSNRLLQAAFQDYEGVLSKFIRFLSDTEILSKYIVSCGDCDQDLDQEYREVRTGQAIFILGDTVEEEVRNTFAILQYAVEHDVKVARTIAMSYSSSRKYQEALKDFNDRVTMVLIRHVETYLTILGIDMGMDDRVTNNISFKNGQVNIANDHATLNASNMINDIDIEMFEKLLEAIKDEASRTVISTEEKDTLDNSLEVIEEEIKNDKPKKSVVKIALSSLKAIKGTAEFGAAVIALAQFLQPLIG